MAATSLTAVLVPVAAMVEAAVAVWQVPAVVEHHMWFSEEISF